MQSTINFESLAAAEKSRAVTDQKNYQDLLRNLSAGKKYDNDTVLTICERAGRNVSMLQEDCAWRTERDRKIAELGKEDEYRAEHQSADAEDSRLYQECAKIEDEYKEKRWVQQAICNRAKQNLQNIDRYKKELLEECRNPIFHEEIGRLDQQLSGATAIRYHQDLLANVRHEITMAQNRIDRQPALGYGSADKVQHEKGLIKDLEARVARIQTTIDDIEKQDRDIEAAKEKIRQQMILD